MTTEQTPSRNCPACAAPVSEDAAFCEACGARVPGARVAPVPQPAGAGELANFWTRFAAYVLDYVIVAFCLPIMATFLVGAGISVNAPVVFIAYSAYFWIGNSLGGTAGKRAAGLAVVDEMGRTPGLARGLTRYVVSLVSALALYVGYLWMIWDGKKQTWHDKAAGTYVVRRAHRAATVS